MRFREKANSRLLKSVLLKRVITRLGSLWTSAGLSSVCAQEHRRWAQPLGRYYHLLPQLGTGVQEEEAPWQMWWGGGGGEELGRARVALALPRAPPGWTVLPATATSLPWCPVSCGGGASLLRGGPREDSDSGPVRLGTSWLQPLA